MSDRVRYPLATMLALVLLRVAIGWHFYSEGVSHATQRGWSSEAFLRAAKGPLADRFQAVLPDFHRWERALHGPADDAALRAIASDDATDNFIKELRLRYTLSEADRASVEPLLRWGARFHDDLAGYLDEFRRHYNLDGDQDETAGEILRRRQAQAIGWLGDNLKSLEDHLHEWSRLEAARGEPTADDVPFQRKRITEKLAMLKKEAASWGAQLEGIEGAYRAEMADLLEPEQAARGLPAGAHTKLESVDNVMRYGILAVGACLLLGLFTRLAALFGAAFLLSVALSQPFWVADAQPTFNQIIEMLALFTLATTPVGRWGGLDFFIHHLLRRQKQA